MANLVPVLFDVLARSEDRPRLAGDGPLGVVQSFHPLDSLFGSEPETGARQLAEFLRPLLIPVPIRRWVEDGTVGLPSFTGDELQAFLKEYPEADPREMEGQRYRFAGLTDSTFLLYPEVDRDAPSVQVMVAVQTSIRVFQMRRVVVPTPVTPDEPKVPADKCVLNGRVVNTYLPYRGACESISCAGGCKPLVVFRPDTVDYILDGCKC